MLLIIKIVISLQTAKYKITSKIRHGMQEVIGSTPIFSTRLLAVYKICKRLFLCKLVIKTLYIDLFTLR